MNFKDMVCGGEFASFGEFARHSYLRGFLGIHGNPDPKTARTFLKERHDVQEESYRERLAYARADLAKAETLSEQWLQQVVAGFNEDGDKEYADEMKRIRATELTAYQAREKFLVEMRREVRAWNAPKELHQVQTYLSSIVEEEDVPEFCKDKRIWTTTEYRAHLIKRYQNDIKYAEDSLVKCMKMHKEELREFDIFESSITEYEQQQKEGS